MVFKGLHLQRSMFLISPSGRLEIENWCWVKSYKYVVLVLAPLLIPAGDGSNAWVPTPLRGALEWILDPGSALAKPQQSRATEKRTSRC